jgi:hypothetical protein
LDVAKNGGTSLLPGVAVFFALCRACRVVAQRSKRRWQTRSAKPVEVIEGDWPMPSVAITAFPGLDHVRA